MKQKTKRRVKILITLIVLNLAAAGAAKLIRLGWETWLNRSGAPGGEIFVIPLIFLLIYLGWTIPRDWAAIKKEEMEDETEQTER